MQVADVSLKTHFGEVRGTHRAAKVFIHNNIWLDTGVVVTRTLLYIHSHDGRSAFLSRGITYASAV